MDWTGGTRHRFAGAKNNNTALQRQKTHFARARAAVRHEPDAGRPRTRIIAHNDDTRARSYKEQSRLSPGFNGTSTNQQKSRSARLIDNEQQHNEELRLLAIRRKLLSRSDWLSLDSTIPLRIKFPAGGDRDRVGRRKKVKRPSVGNGIATEPRRQTPLFEEGLRQREPGCFMSGALPPANDEQIKIRVGTSALDSRSQLLKESEALRAVSTGPPSTAPSRLSEECMLLGADGDNFDADQVEVPAYMQNEASSSGSSNPSLSLNFGGRPSTCETVLNSLTPGLNHEPQATHMQDGFDITRPSIEYQSDMQQVTRGRSAGHCFAPETRTLHPHDEQETADLLLSLDQTPTARHGMTVSVDQNASEVDTEYMWKQLMGISANSDTLTSCKDMDPWIERITASDTTQGAVIGDLHSDIGVDNATGVQPTAQTSDKTTTDTAKHCDGLNAPLMVPLHDLQNVSAHSPICPHNDPQANKDDEALWREFIIGSQDSGSEDELHLAWQPSRDKARYSTEPRSLELSGLGTSDKATRGGASIVASAIDPSQETSSDGHIEPDEDGIEDPPVESSSPVNNPRNIHTMSTKWLDPKRFKKLGDTDNVVTRGRTQSKIAARRQIRHAGKNSRKSN